MNFQVGEFYIVTPPREEKSFIVKCISSAEYAGNYSFLFLKFDPESNNLFGSHFSLTNKDEVYHVVSPPQHWRYAQEIRNRYNNAF